MENNLHFTHAHGYSLVELKEQPFADTTLGKLLNSGDLPPSHESGPAQLFGTQCTS